MFSFKVFIVVTELNLISRVVFYVEVFKQVIENKGLDDFELGKRRGKNEKIVFFDVKIKVFMIVIENKGVDFLDQNLIENLLDEGGIDAFKKRKYLR